MTIDDISKKINNQGATPQGRLSAEELNTIVEQVKANRDKVAATGMSISGTLNLSQTGTAVTMATIYAALENNQMRFYLVTDSDGGFTGGSVTAAEAVAKLFGKYSLGVSVGDICVIAKMNSLPVYRILPLNDAKAASGDFPGADGLETVWDKTQVNKIPGIETTANEARRIGESAYMPSLGESNMNNALQPGVYPWCTLGRPTGSTGAYSCIVQKSYNADGGGYYTIEQTAYGREGELGQVYKRIIFQKNDGSDTQYGEWKAISNTIDNRGTVNSKNDVVEPGWYNFDGGNTGPNGDYDPCQIIKIAETSGSSLEIAAYPNGDKFIRCIHDGYTANWTKIRPTDKITVEKDLTDFTSYAAVTEDEFDKILTAWRNYCPLGIQVTVGELAMLTFTNINIFAAEDGINRLSSVCYGNYDSFTNEIDEYRLLIYPDSQSGVYKLRVIKDSKDGLLFDYNIPDNNTLKITVNDWNNIGLSHLANYILIKVTDSNGNIYQFNTPPQQFSNSDYSEYVWTYNSPTQVGTTIFYMRHDNTTDTYVAGLTYKS